MTTLHGEEINVGDRVWSLFLGWGEVVELHDKNSTSYPIGVQWKEGFGRFSEDGKLYKKDLSPVLFWQPVEIKIPKKPKRTEKAWRWVYTNHQTGILWVTNEHYTSADEFYSKYPKASHRAIEPFLPSEIERELGGEE